jgi:hypothetical protein
MNSVGSRITRTRKRKRKRKRKRGVLALTRWRFAPEEFGV